MHTIEFTNVRLAELRQVAMQIATQLRQGEPFVCWLNAEMGTGKTTLTKQLLLALGLDSKVDVQSPTFTYMNEYSIGGSWYAHLDLYRAEEGSFSLDQIGVLDTRDFSGLFIEWPDAIAEVLEKLPPTHRITLSFVDEDRRNIQLATY